MAAAQPSVSFALGDTTNIPVTPPVGKKTRAINVHTATPAKGAATPIAKGTPKPAPSTPAGEGASIASTPAKTPGRTRPNRAKSVPPRPKFEAELGSWDKERLVKELIDREIAVANLEEDVSAWSDKWSTLKEDGQELYKEFINHSMRNKRFSEAIVSQKKEVDDLKKKTEEHEEEIQAIQQKHEKEIATLNEKHAKELEAVKATKSDEAAPAPTTAVRSARETALLNQNVALQDKCNAYEAEQAKLNQKNMTLLEQVSKLEAQVVELQAVAHGVDQDNASKAALAGSPVRKLEALTIRTEALRARNTELEQKIASESIARQSAERELRGLKNEIKEKETRAEKSISAAKEESKQIQASYEEHLAVKDNTFKEEKGKIEAKIVRLEAVIRDQSQRMADILAARSDISTEAQQANERVKQLEGEREILNEEIDKHKSACAVLEGDIRLLYQKHRNDLKELDAKYNRQDYKGRYHRVMREKKVLEQKLAMAMETLETIPTMSASSHILAGLLNAGVDAVQSQQRVILRRRDGLHEQETEINVREQSLRQLKEQAESEKSKASSMEARANLASDERQQLEGALKAHKYTLGELRQTITSLEYKVTELETELAAAQVVKTALADSQEELYKEEIDALKSRQQQQSQHIQSLRQQVVKLEETLKDRELLLEENEFVQTENQSRLLEDNDRLAKLVSTVQKEREDLLAMVDLQSQALQDLDEKLQITVQKLEETMVHRETLTSQTTTLQTQLRNALSAWKGTQRALKSEREHRAANKRQLRKEIAELQTLHEKASQDLLLQVRQREEEAHRLADELQDVQNASTHQIASLQRMLDAATNTGSSTELNATKERLREVEAQLVNTRSQFEKANNKWHDDLVATQAKLRDALQSRSEEANTLASMIQQMEVKAAEIEKDFAKKAEKADAEWRSRLVEKESEVKRSEAQLQSEKKAFEDKLKDAQLNAANGSNVNVNSLMREYAKTMSMLTQETDARVAQERAQNSTLQVQVQSLMDQLDSAQRSLRESKSDLARTHLIEQQLLLQLELLLGLHQRLSQQLSAKQSGEQVQQLVQQITQLRAELARLQREALVWRQKSDEASQHRDELIRDRDAIRTQLMDTQMDYQEKLSKLTDDPWKAISRQQKQLWLKFQQTLSAEATTNAPLDEAL